MNNYSTKNKTMKTFKMKITPGIWDCSDRFIMANTDSDSINVGELNRLNDQYKANAQLIAEAGTVANETGLTPRALLEQRNELAQYLDLIIAEIDSNPTAVRYFDTRIISKAKESIKNTTT